MAGIFLATDRVPIQRYWAVEDIPVITRMLALTLASGVTLAFLKNMTEGGSERIIIYHP